MIYIEELKFRVINKFGKNIISKPDAKELRDVIFLFQKEYLSESTIRRVFYLIPSGIASSVTLDILSRYIGFKSYMQFCDFCEKTMYLSINDDSDELILNGLQEKNILSLLELNLIAYRIIQCIKEQDYDGIIKYFNHEPLYRLISSNDSTADFFGQKLGPYFEKQYYIKKPISILNTAYFIPLVLHKYVDTQNKSLEMYYEWIIINHNNKNDLIFSASVLSLNRIYSNDFEEAEKYYQLIDKSFQLSAPVLNGRIALLDWYFSNDFDELIAKAKIYQDHLLFFSIDIIPYMVFYDKISCLKRWFDHFPNFHLNEKTWVEKDIIFFYRIAKFIAEENFEEVKRQLTHKFKMLNSDTTNSKIYSIIEKKYSI